MKKKMSTKKEFDKIIDSINATSSIIALSDASKASLQYSSIKNPELMRTCEKITIHSIKKRN